MITLNGKEVVFGKFPNGEINLPVGGLSLLTNNEVKLVYEDDSDFIRLALVKGWIDDMNCTATLYLAYMYGDSITLDRCEQICRHLKAKGFASTNMVYGIGSYTYQHNTRDSFGFALKSTMCVIDGDQKQIFKNPATDEGTKKSNIGVVSVTGNSGAYQCVDGLLIGHDVPDQMRDVFVDGTLLVDETLGEVRRRLLCRCHAAA